MKIVTISTEEKWYYDCQGEIHRGILGTVGTNPLICIGCNCSTAKPGDLDPTIRIVREVAAQNGYDSFIMLNLNTYRATNPNDLPRDDDIRNQNIQYNISCFKKVFQRFPDADVWCAWGGLIEERKYLREMLVWICKQYPQLKTFSRGAILKKGHPHHPLYVRKTAPLQKFNLDNYVV